jgi:hypothetical protein
MQQGEHHDQLPAPASAECGPRQLPHHGQQLVPAAALPWRFVEYDAPDDHGRLSPAAHRSRPGHGRRPRPTRPPPDARGWSHVPARHELALCAEPADAADFHDARGRYTDPCGRLAGPQRHSAQRPRPARRACCWVCPG